MLVEGPLISSTPTSPTAASHSNILPRNPFSNLPTSFLNASTSFQQSNGLRSFTLKQVTTSCFAFSTALSPITSSLSLLCCSFFLKTSISFCTLWRPRFRSLSASALAPWSAPPGEDDWSEIPDGWEDSVVESGRADICSSSSLRERVASASRRESSAWTRDWMWSSRSLARVLSVYGTLEM